MDDHRRIDDTCHESLLVGKMLLFSPQRDTFLHVFATGQLVVRMLSWGAPRATLPVFIGGDAAVVRGVGADRGMRMGH